MPTPTITMRKLKEILRLKYGAGLSHRQIARSLVISPSVVSRYANRAAQLGLVQWPLPPHWDDATLKRAFLNTRVQLRKHTLPDWAEVHKALAAKTVTLQLLWEEYTQRHPGGHYSYNHYCRLYKAWAKTTAPSMRQPHQAGEKLFIDYCGPTLPVINPDTGEARKAQVFVATLGASSYTYAEATWSQTLEDWVMSHVRCFQYLGGTPALVVPDNLKSSTARACRYDPDINPTYQQMLAHYQVAVMPARPAKPRDKAKVESAVQVVERWIMGKLRHETFFSLASLNQRIAQLLAGLNQKPMQKLNASRRTLFEQLDKPALNPLPRQPYLYTQVKKVRVHPDYHVEVEKHYYSVPYQLLRTVLEAHVSREQVTLYHQGTVVAVHPRRHQCGYSTQEKHMPPAHQHHAQWTPERLLEWATLAGEHVKTYVTHILATRQHPEQGYRYVLGVMGLHKSYGYERLNNACHRALAMGIYRLKGLKSILDKGLDKQPVPARHTVDPLADLEHTNVRGSHYYH
ncbi:transposase [Xenorhabdus nematophila ATCC 19061]|uniref:Transposase n=1 Tax=Xenorhabdus nematophila (strain ATCC 19061 / DSM 3370 / CCUG 14189 / LMG 1036 / NCIMB 9965 / AN6) TaxID=406817 RepID=D3VAU3_XENNA|nr:IS21 family transposase [Xenorhabdus nematophila]CBJ89843.1 transposase [Xenorhabdus nematophila ATCC 19061]CBJ90059.1 transposase [Xenorhabdus nematophila ATCC 19061]CBJ91718.1 transposase [Xenorhabdus nematophila ATCC 19061]CBJ92294.1 transposase [Xenorhabdus nematophila ATCC 19061]CEK22726.1 transposase [Xenorhabdus nematophila AN6/1]